MLVSVALHGIYLYEKAVSTSFVGLVASYWSVPRVPI